MKIKYLRLNKLEKKKAKEDFLKTENGIYVHKKLVSVFWCALLCIFISIYIIIDAYLKNGSIWEYVYGFSILLCGLIFLFFCRKIYIKKINDFITKK